MAVDRVHPTQNHEPASTASNQLPGQVRFEDVYQTFYSQLVRVARGVGLRPEEAEDTAQNVFEEILMRMQSDQDYLINNQKEQGTFLRRRTKWRATDSIRKQKDEQSIDIIAQDIAALISTAPYALVDHIADLEQAMEVLSDKERIILGLIEQGFTAEEIAQQLNISTRSAVDSAVWRARRKLKEQNKEESPQ